MITFFKDGKSDVGYLTELQQKVNFNKNIDVVDCSVIFMLASLCEQMAIDQEPNVLITVMEDLDYLLDTYEKGLMSPIYAEIKQNMYITLVLSKPNGREFAEGSLKYTEEEYTAFDYAIRKEIADQVQEVSQKIGLNLNAILAVQ
jgi:hypothetical protein